MNFPITTDTHHHNDSQHHNVLLLVSLFLCAMSLVLVTRHKSIFHDSKDYFVSPMSTEEKREMLDLLQYFLSLLDSNGLEYFIDGGTLIGSIRHHGPIPWDDDIDILIHVKDKVKLSAIVSKQHPTFKLYNGSDLFAHYGQWKFFRSNSSRSFIHRPFRWPYIDIWFYYMNATHIINEKKPLVTMKKIDVFPLTTRPFGGLNITATCNASEILKHFAIEMCMTRSFSHIFEVPLYNWMQRVVPCRDLYPNSPFTFVQTSGGLRSYHEPNSDIGVRWEVVKVGNRIISNVSVFQPRCGVI